MKAFSETEIFEDVVEFSEAQVAELALKYSNVGVALVGARPPCMSRGQWAQCRRKDRDGRSSLFVHVPRILCTVS